MPPIKKILTENPYEELWSHLSYFENHYNCREYLKRNHNLPNLYMRKERASILQFYIKQAHEYFNSSLRTSLLTQPTLLYYGMLCLSKALFLCKKGYPDHSTRHGLQEDRNRGLSSLKDFKIKITKTGAFSELYRTIQSNSHPPFEEIKWTEWTLDELLSMVPEIKDIYEDIYGKKSKVLKIHRVLDEDGEYIKIKDDFFSRMEKEDIELFIQNINGFNDFYLNPQFLQDSSFISYKKSKGDLTQKNLMGEEFFISGIEKDDKIINLPEMSLHLMLLYLLSMLSRYHISLWGEGSLELENGDFYIIKHFLRLSTRKYPNLVLNLIMDENYVFTSELYKPQDLRVDQYKSQILEIVNEVLEKKDEDKRMEKILRDSKDDLWD